MDTLSDKQHDDSGGKRQGVLSILPEKTCAICYQDQHPSAASESEAVLSAAATVNVFEAGQTDIVNPYQTIPCGCIYCYVCIANALEASEGDGYVCLRCGTLVKQCKPWDGDILENGPRL